MRSKLIIGLVVLPLLAPALSAEASRKPKPSESAAIFTALQAENLTCARYQPGTCKIAFRISDANSRWASARIRADENGENTVLPQTISLHRPHSKSRRWEVIDTGDGGGCSVPKRPRRDLNLICLQFGS